MGGWPLIHQDWNESEHLLTDLVAFSDKTMTATSLINAFVTRDIKNVSNYILNVIIKLKKNFLF